MKDASKDLEAPTVPLSSMMKAGDSLEAPSAPLMLVQVERVLDNVQLCLLRRAATVLLIFSILSFNIFGWLGFFAACTIHCSSANSLSRRTCRVKVASSFAAGFAIIGFAACVACVIAGVPQHFSHEMQRECYSMPQDTFAWSKQAIASIEPAGDYNPKLNTVQHDETNKVAIDDSAHHHTFEISGHHEIFVAWYSPHRALKAVADLVNPEQKQLCNRAAHFVADWGSVLLLAVAFIQWCLFVSAIIVAMYVCRVAHHPCAAIAAPAVIVASPITSESALA